MQKVSAAACAIHPESGPYTCFSTFLELLNSSSLAEREVDTIAAKQRMKSLLKR
jgi:hypothetical protein